jgi:hypothetical protein
MNSPDSNPVAWRAAIADSTVSSSGRDITIQCDSHEDKEVLMNFLIETAYAHPQPPAGEREALDWPSREVVAREIRRAMLDNPTDESFNKRAEKREAIANDAADAIIARFNATTTHSPVRSTMAGVDPAEIWEEYIKETPRANRTPQGAIAFAVDRIAALNSGGGK